MALSSAIRKPARMSLTNLALAKTIEVPLNPETLEESVGPVYSALVVPGLPHQILQYESTENHRIEFALAFDATLGIDMGAARNFLLSLPYPRRGASNVSGGAPGRVLVVWPGWLALTCALAGPIRITHSRFHVDGPPTFFVAKLSLQEIRDVRLVAEDVLSLGTRRSPTGS